ncbi:hypothetical protein EAE96_002711 [Botrytis aclada]|nr:hypothetical protein EAE96_002711 [Botrytis aclada]
MAFSTLELISSLNVNSEQIPKFLWRSFLILIACVIFRNIIVWTYRLFFHPLSRYPGPWLAKVSDIYGAYHNYRGQLHIESHKAHERYGKFVRQGPNKLIVNSQEGLYNLYLSKSVQKSYGYETMLPAPGAYNVFTAIDKDLHKFKRKVLSQGFADSSMRSFEPTILNHIDIFVQYLKDSAAKSGSDGWSAPVNMTKRCRYLGYDVMGEFGFGQSFELQKNSKNDFLIKAVEATSMKAGVYVQYPRLTTLKLETILARRTTKMRERYLELMAGLVRTRLASGKGSHQDLFSFVIDAKDPDTGKGFSENELWAESRFLLIAGADTTSTALTSLFFYLSRNKACYGKLVAEIRSTFGSVSEIETGPRLAECHYLRACIDESMRMSPPISSTLWRTISAADGVWIHGNYIPKGVDIGVSPYAFHHNDEVFPDSYKFKPDRWIESPENSSEAIEKARAAFSPFSIGTRACAGRTMAYTEISDTIARTLWALDIKPAEGSLGRIGEGMEGSGKGYDRKGEFQLKDHITCCHNGPYLQFKLREKHP